MTSHLHFSHFFKLLLLFLFVLGGCSSLEPDREEQRIQDILDRYPELEGKTPEFSTVQRVVDGDTFELSTGEKVRLIGVDTPETVKPGSPVEAYGKEASNFTKKQLEGNDIILFRDVSDQDRYGRLLRYVFISGDAVMFNERLIAEGYAQVSTFPPDVLYAEHFLTLQQTASSNQLGLWGTGNSTENAPAAASSDPISEANCASPMIKGNINSSKEKIYHTPESPQYDVTKPEMWFCTESEAEAAGFRKAGQK
ncbi:thermonuclease family protein [Marinicrinis lubricantis]|uniref:Thermonuclease family protein n=1 Tax=Marinicrinis lubricantis TaxID=2086470 RepID=A0ABW1IMQ3_9BACL